MRAVNSEGAGEASPEAAGLGMTVLRFPVSPYLTVAAVGESIVIPSMKS